MHWDEVKQWWKEKTETQITFDDALVNMQADLGRASEGQLNINADVKYDPAT